MTQVLLVKGWAFRFSVDATSPNGFHYAADGANADEAFLKAFRMWRSEFADLVGKVSPIEIPATSSAAPVKTGRLYQAVDNKERRAYARRLKAQSRKDWTAGYLHSAQEKKRLTRKPISWGGALRASWEKQKVAA